MAVKNLFKKLGRSKKKNYIKLNYMYEHFKEPRWGYTKPPHPLLYELINKKRSAYEELLQEFSVQGKAFLDINKEPDESSPGEPCFNNSWLPGLDALALYSLLAIYKPKQFVEVGSGNSTKFARRSIADNELGTRVISIDPQPRAEIDLICDEVIRKPVEKLDLSFFDRLAPGDFLFIDNSHRSFMNNDVTTVFIDVLPRLKPGVIVEFHDIFLPNDYPARLGRKYYSEQYLLAAYLLSGGDKIDILMPNNFVSLDAELRAVVDPLFPPKTWKDLNRDGFSFWIITG